MKKVGIGRILIGSNQDTLGHEGPAAFSLQTSQFHLLTLQQ